MAEQIALSEKDLEVWESFISVVKEDLANKIKGVAFDVTMEIEFAKLENRDAFFAKLQKVKIKGKETGLFDIKKKSDRFVISYVIDGRN